jgi:hypothetical protein
VASTAEELVLFFAHSYSLSNKEKENERERERERERDSKTRRDQSGSLFDLHTPFFVAVLVSSFFVFFVVCLRFPTDTRRQNFETVRAETFISLFSFISILLFRKESEMTRQNKGR